MALVSTYVLWASLWYVASILALPFSREAQWNIGGTRPLRFTEKGTFQISIFEDLHYGEAEDMDWGPQQDVKTEKVINAILDVESPQLVVLNGDLITGENTFSSNSSLYLDEIVRPLVQRDIPWASTYGNHDSNFNLSSEAILERERRYSGSRTGRMVFSPNAGVTNYYLPVFSSDGNDAKPALILWFFDSRGGSHYHERDTSGNDIPYPNFVDESVVQWFRITKERLRSYLNQETPSLAFVHIPVNAMAAFQKAGVNPSKEPGINDDNPLDQQGIVGGVYTGQDVPFMSELLNTPGLMALFSGHDHGDDWCFNWDSRLPGMNLTGNGLHVCFGRHSGYGGYGNWARGSRQILLEKKTSSKEIDTWIRLEDYTISGRVTLNATYGQDEYLPVEKKLEIQLEQA